MKWIRHGAMLCLAVAMLFATAQAQGLPKIDFEKYELPNGLDVILHQDSTIPMVAVNIWYHVGSKNEEVGRTGFAHLFEHMMFQGSEHHDAEYFAPLEKIGAAINGSTSEDRTNYWENVPSNYLELALWLESDRMGFLIPAMTQEKLDNQRDVVKNERRQGLDNAPYAKSYELMLPMLYPDDHPYSWPVIGSMEDLTAASLEDVQAFFRQYYHPANASLCIAGDFDKAEAKRLVEKYFAPIPPGPPVDRLTGWIPELDGVKRGVAEDNVNLPRLYYAWHTPGYYQPGDAEFDILANALASGKTSRLYKELVYDRQIAQDVSAYQSSGEISSTFNIEVTAKEGHTLAELEEAVDAIIRDVLATGITPAELKQAQTSWEANFVRSLQSVGGFGGRADKLNDYNVRFGDPDGFARDLNRYLNATVQSVSEYARKYLDMNRRVIFHIVPQGELAAQEIEFDRTVKPAPAAERAFAPPQIERTKLSNGLDVLVVSDHKLPLVHTNLVLKSGWSADPVDRPGAAALTAELLDEGTKNRTALQISEAQKVLGANLSTGSTFDGTNVNLNVLKKHLGAGLELMADVVLNPTFPADELERQRQLYLGQIAQEEKQPFTIAIKTYYRALYGKDHPYGQPYTGSGTEESINAIQRSDLETFYKSHYFPNNAAVVMVGDITLDEARTLVQQHFGRWNPGTVAQTEVPDPPLLTESKLVIVDKPGAAQSIIVAGNPAIERSHPDYMAFDVMNNALGGQFTSRINMNLREDKGYTYGAGSALPARRGVAPFLCYAPVQSQSTKESVVEILNEFRDVVGTRPLTDKEVAESKDNMIKSFPQQFQNFSGIAGQLGLMVRYDLPQDEWDTYVERVKAIDGRAATDAAKKYLHPDALMIVVVGDKASIEPKLRELNLSSDVSPW